MIGKDSRICPGKQLSIEIIVAFLEALDESKWAIYGGPDSVTVNSRKQAWNPYKIMALDDDGKAVRGGFKQGQKCDTHLQCQKNFFCHDDSIMSSQGYCKDCVAGCSSNNWGSRQKVGETLGTGSIDNDCTVCMDKMFVDKKLWKKVTT